MNEPPLSRPGDVCFIPPVGSCLFVSYAIDTLSIENTVRKVRPIYLAIFVALMLINFIPATSQTLPGLLDD